MWLQRQLTTAAVGGWASCPVFLGDMAAAGAVHHPQTLTNCRNGEHIECVALWLCSGVQGNTRGTLNKIVSVVFVCQTS